MCEASDGSYVITGHTNSYGSGTFDLWLIKVSSLYPQFTAEPPTGHAPLEVNFADLSLGNVISWQWDFDNDDIIDSEEQNPFWTYENPGVYTVKLDVSNGLHSQTVIRENSVHVFDGESALLFNGEDSYASCPTAQSLNLTYELTIEAWMNPAGWGFPTLGLGRVVDKRNISLYLVYSYLSFNTHMLVF